MPEPDAVPATPAAPTAPAAPIAPAVPTAPAAPAVILTPYDQHWPGRAATVIAELLDLLGPAVVHADHIGSTSVPAMAAKDVLDLQLSVLDLAQAESTFEKPLARMGFVSLPYQLDHVPAGRADSPQRWAKRTWSRRGRGDDVNLHVRLVGSPNERLALLFRDWLRAHPDAVLTYAAFKTALAAAVPDLRGYTLVKDPVVDLVAVVAEAWADASGWQPHPPARGSQS